MMCFCHLLLEGQEVIPFCGRPHQALSLGLQTMGHIHTLVWNQYLASQARRVDLGTPRGRALQQGRHGQMGPMQPTGQPCT